MTTQTHFYGPLEITDYGDGNGDEQAAQRWIDAQPSTS